MKKIRIKHIFLQNFGKFFGANTVDADIPNRTEICGVNESGKTTIKRAVQYVLNCRDDNGKEITGIRPHDESGNDYSGIETTCAVTFDIDGTEKELKKVFRESINKNGDFVGNITDSYVNDVPKKVKDYAELLEDSFLDADKLQYCLNAQSLLKKSPADQRTVLEKTFGDKTVLDIAQEDEQFASIVPMLSDGTIKELKERCNRTLNGSRGKSSSKGLRQIADEYAPRIDELMKQKTDIDVSQLQSMKLDIESKIEDVNGKIKDASAEHDALGQEILNLKFELSGLQNKANESLDKTRAELTQKSFDANKELIAQKNIQNDLLRKKESLEAEFKRHVSLREQYAEDWKRTNAETIGENDTICPTCHRELENADEIRERYEETKKQRLDNIVASGNFEKSELDRCKAEIEQTEKKIQEQGKKVSELQIEYDSLNNRIDGMPVCVDITNTSEYKKVKSELDEKEALYNKEAIGSNLVDSLKEELKKLQHDLLDVTEKIGEASVNDYIDNQISQLREQQRDTQQKIADQESILDLLKKLDRKKNEILSENVNQYLEFCKVRLFRPLINGDTEECCEFIYKGEPYNRNMNHGAKLLTEIDICRAFQRKNDVEMPIIIDDTESLDAWRIPEIDTQLIVIRRTDDKELIIKNMEEK